MPILNPEDYIEPACPLGKPAPDAHGGGGLDVPAIIAELDALLESGREERAAGLLEENLAAARKISDWQSEISILSEQTGLLRRTKDKRALTAANAALGLLYAHHMETSVSGATVMLNAATTLSAFGQSEKALPIFKAVMRAYGESLDPADYRFAGLYNNMALTLSALGDYGAAESFFARAASILKICPSPENELAVTECNLARLYYAQNPEDPRCDACMERAWDYLNSESLPRDGYYAFTASKCAPDFDFFGFFLYSAQLKKRVGEIYERS